MEDIIEKLIEEIMEKDFIEKVVGLTSQ